MAASNVNLLQELEEGEEIQVSIPIFKEGDGDEVDHVSDMEEHNDRVNTPISIPDDDEYYLSILQDYGCGEEDYPSHSKEQNHSSYSELEEGEIEEHDMLEAEPHARKHQRSPDQGAENIQKRYQVAQENRPIEIIIIDQDGDKDANLIPEAIVAGDELRGKIAQELPPLRVLRLADFLPEVSYRCQMHILAHRALGDNVAGEIELAFDLDFEPSWTGRSVIPLPLGRYGHPFFEGWAWEDFDARWLWDQTHPQHVAVGSTLWCQLAREASELEFQFRSATQREIVSMALYRNIKLAPQFPEPNVLHTCRYTPSLLPLAIRRNYTVNRERNVFYAEYDLHDLAIYLVLYMAGPHKNMYTKPIFKEQLQLWLQLLPKFSKWLAQNLHQVPKKYPKTFACPEAWTEEISPYMFDQDEPNLRLLAHLQRCGLVVQRLYGQGDIAIYLNISEWYYLEQNRLVQEYRSQTGRSNQKEERQYVDGHIEYGSIPEDHERIRVQLSRELKVKLAKRLVEGVLQ